MAQQVKLTAKLSLTDDGRWGLTIDSTDQASVDLFRRMRLEKGFSLRGSMAIVLQQDDSSALVLRQEPGQALHMPDQTLAVYEILSDYTPKSG